MESFYKKMGIIIGFLIMMLCIEQFISDKAGEKMALLILFTMIILNADTFSSAMSNLFKSKEKEEKEEKPVAGGGVGGGGSGSW